MNEFKRIPESIKQGLGLTFLDFIKIFIIDQYKMGQCQTIHNSQKIDILHIPTHDLISQIPLESCLHKYPQRSIQIKKIEQTKIGQSAKNAFSYQTVTLKDENNQDVLLKCKNYFYLSSALLSQNQGLELTQVLNDQLNCDRVLFLGKKQQKNFSLIVRNFKDFSHQSFLNIQYEIHTYQKIGKLNSPYLHKIIDSYIISSNNSYVNTHSQAIILQPINCNLSLIIKHRRQKNIPWTVVQFYVLMNNMIEAVDDLHKAGYVHNDIRPSNIYYSDIKQSFVLGSFSNVKYANLLQQSVKHRSQVHYREKNRKIQLNSLNVEVENKKADIYSLGMSLLAAFYLLLLTDRKKSAPFNRLYEKDFPFLSIIKHMICKIQKRKSIQQIKQKMKELEKHYFIHDQYTIQLEDYQLIAKDYVDMYKRERLIADGYKMLSLVGSWKEKLKNRHIHKKVSDNSVENAKYYEQLAIISHLQGKIQKSKNFYIHSAEIYSKAGESNFKQRDFQNAITYYQQGLDNLSMIEDRQSDLTYLKLLVSLYQTKIISGSALITEQQLLKQEKLILKIKEVEPFAFWQLAQQLINIYKYYQNYNKIYDLLKICLQVSPHIQTKIGPITLEKMVIENNLKMAELKNKQSIHRRAIIQQTELSIFTILNDKQYYFISHPLQKLQLMLLSSKFKVLKGAQKQALKLLEELLQYCSEDHVDEVQNPQDKHKRNRYFTLKSEIYEDIGDIWFTLEEFDESFRYYTLAIENYKEYFGDIYNIQSAQLFEKIALIYKNRKDQAAYADSIGLVIKILKTEYGSYHKDILRLKQICSKQIEHNKWFDVPSILNQFKSQTDLGQDISSDQNSNL